MNVAAVYGRNCLRHSNEDKFNLLTTELQISLLYEQNMKH